MADDEERTISRPTDRQTDTASTCEHGALTDDRTLVNIDDGGGETNDVTSFQCMSAVSRKSRYQDEGECGLTMNSTLTKERDLVVDRVSLIDRPVTHSDMVDSGPTRLG